MPVLEALEAAGARADWGLPFIIRRGPRAVHYPGSLPQMLRSLPGLRRRTRP